MFGENFYELESVRESQMRILEEKRAANGKDRKFSFGDLFLIGFLFN